MMGVNARREWGSEVLRHKLAQLVKLRFQPLDTNPGCCVHQPCSSFGLAGSSMTFAFTGMLSSSTKPGWAIRSVSTG